jgi:hypothetical protein
MEEEVFVGNEPKEDLEIWSLETLDAFHRLASKSAVSQSHRPSQRISKHAVKGKERKRKEKSDHRIIKGQRC